MTPDPEDMTARATIPLQAGSVNRDAAPARGTALGLRVQSDDKAGGLTLNHRVETGEPTRCSPLVLKY
jgi:hypothetical protein